MIRITRGVTKQRRYKALLSKTKGFQTRGKNIYRIGLPRFRKSLSYAYRDRRQRKRQFRSFWISQLNSNSLSTAGLPYSLLIEGLKSGGLNFNRKVLYDLSKRLLNNPTLPNSDLSNLFNIIKLKLVRIAFTSEFKKQLGNTLYLSYFSLLEPLLVQDKALVAFNPWPFFNFSKPVLVSKKRVPVSFLYLTSPVLKPLN